MHEPSSLYSNVHLIGNEKAAQDGLLRAALGELRDAGIEARFHPNRGGGYARDFTVELIVAGADAILASGGDGTVNEVLNGFMAVSDYDCAMGILPYGTANDFARSLSLDPAEPAKFLGPLLRGKVNLVDVGKLNEHHFLNVASGGEGARVTTGTPPEIKKIFGGAAYFLTGIVHLAQPEISRLKIAGDNCEWEGDSLVICIGNGCTAGGGIPVCPRANYRDGLLDLLIVPELAWGEFVSAWTEILGTGKIHEHPSVKYFQSPWFTIESLTNDLQINLDGEPIFARHYDVKVLPQVLKLLTL